MAYADRRPRGRGGSSVRLLVRVSAVSAWGKTKNSKWSLSSASSSKRSSVSCSGAGASTPRSMNAGTQWRVTSAITPSAPSPTRAARKTSGSRSGEQDSVEPSASTSVSSLTWQERLRSRAPVPCVAVEMAPAMVCASMSPRFSRARPCASSRRLNSRIVIPACTRTKPESRSTSRTRVRRSSISISPSVQAMSLKECPAPATRTLQPSRAACSSAPDSSSIDAGRRTAAGAQR